MSEPQTIRAAAGACMAAAVSLVVVAYWRRHASDVESKTTKGKDSHPFFDCIVVGGGMVGSAAAYHFSRLPSCKVALVAGRPGSPSSHNDAHRLVNMTSSQKHPGYTDDVLHSLEGFAEVEQISGIKFFHRSGVLNVQGCVKIEGCVGEQVLDNQALEELLPGIDVQQEFDGSYKAVLTPVAGWLEPRAFVEAHNKAAQSLGCEQIDEDVVHLKRVGNNVHDKGSAKHPRWLVVTHQGRALVCTSVVFALGAWTNVSKLLPEPVNYLDLKLWGKTVYHLELDAADALKLEGMPGVIIHPNAQTTVQSSVAYSGPKAADYFYFFPPVKYSPSARASETIRIKIGHSPYDPLISDVDGTDEREKLANWMSGTGDVTTDVMRRSKEFFDAKLRNLFPRITWKEGVVTTCVTTKTRDGEVFLGALPHAAGVFVCAGCNGSGAAKAHEWGRILSVLVRCEPKTLQ